MERMKDIYKYQLKIDWKKSIENTSNGFWNFQNYSDAKEELISF